MNKIRYYSIKVSNWITGGLLTDKIKISALGVRPLYNRIVTRKYNKAVISIDEMVKELDINLIRVIQNEVNNSFPDSRVIFNIKAKHSELNRLYSSKEFKTRMEYAESDYQNYKEFFDANTNNTEKRMGKILRFSGGTVKLSAKDLEKKKYIIDSYNHIFDSKTRGNTFVESYLCMEVISPSSKELKRVIEIVSVCLERIGCTVRLLNGKYDSYLKSHSPTGFLNVKTTPVEETILDTPGLSYLMPVKDGGLLTDGKGIIMGIDKEKYCPFSLNFTGNTSRQVNLISASADSGKTTLSKSIALGLIDQDVHVSVLDIKKDEWNQLFYLQPGVELDFSDNGDCFVNTLRLDDVPDYPGMTIDIAKNLYTSAVESTTEQILTACGADIINGIEYSSYLNLVKEAITKYLDTSKVDPNQLRTYKLTRNLSMEGVVGILSQLKELSKHAHNVNKISDIINKTNSTLVNSNILKGREVTIMDVIKSPLVVYSLGLNGSSTNNILTTRIRTSMITFLDSKKIFLRKIDKKHTACFYEELQSSDSFSSLIPYINRVVTGGRSSNVTVFLICNSTSILKNPKFKNTMDNISTYIIGPYNDNTLDDFIGTPAESIIPLVSKITNEKTKYKHSFACHFDTGQFRDNCIFSAVLTEDIERVCRSRDSA